MTLFDYPRYKPILEAARLRDEAIKRARKARRGDKLRSQGEVRAWTRRLLEMERRAGMGA